MGEGTESVCTDLIPSYTHMHTQTTHEQHMCRHPKLRIAKFTQHHLEMFDMELDAVQVCVCVCVCMCVCVCVCVQTLNPESQTPNPEPRRIGLRAGPAYPSDPHLAWSIIPFFNGKPQHMRNLAASVGESDSVEEARKYLGRFGLSGV